MPPDKDRQLGGGGRELAWFDYFFFSFPNVPNARDCSQGVIMATDATHFHLNETTKEWLINWNDVTVVKTTTVSLFCSTDTANRPNCRMGECNTNIGVILHKITEVHVLFKFFCSGEQHIHHRRTFKRPLGVYAGVYNTAPCLFFLFLLPLCIRVLQVFLCRRTYIDCRGQ